MSGDAGGGGAAPAPRIETQEFDPSELAGLLPEGWTITPPAGPAPLTPRQRAEGARVLAQDAAAYAAAVAARLEKYRAHAAAVIPAMEGELSAALAQAQAADEAAAALEADAGLTAPGPEGT